MDEKTIDVLLMSDNGLETVGGEQESTKILINGLKDKYTLGVIQPGKVSKPKSGVNYFDLTEHKRIKHLIKNPFKFIQYILNVRRIIRANEPKIIHTQAQVSFFIVAILKKFRCVSKDIILIHTERGLFMKYNRLFKYLFFFFMKELDTLVTTTKINLEHWENALKKRNLVLTYKIIENTAGELFETYDNSLENSEQKKFTIGFAGRYTDWKNWPLAVDIAKKLNKMTEGNIEVKMSIGCLDDESLKDTELMYKKLHTLLGDRFQGEINITLEEMNEFYYDIDVFILTSKHNTESFGRTLVEAMSRKTAVLTTDAGGSVEVVGNQCNVHNTAGEFSDKIMSFYTNRDKLAEEKKANLIRVKSLYSLDNYLDKHLEMYSDILNVKLEEVWTR